MCESTGSATVTHGKSMQLFMGSTPRLGLYVFCLDFCQSTKI